MPRNFFSRHPLLRDALVWAIPALLAGAALRLVLLYYSPYAYYGSDTRSFMGFTTGVLNDFYFSINEKRRYLYPLFLFPISLLPGGTMKWLGGIQAALGLASVLPLAYAVRRIFTGWRWVILPVTLLYAGMPVLIWYEQESIADSLCFDAIVWAMAGWAAWTSQSDRLRAGRLWWIFWAPLALLMLSKPSGKFLWPGIVAGLLLIGAWRVLRWRQWAALGALFLASLTVGAENQGAWLLYTSSFPFTRLDTPLHAEYKAEIRDRVLEKRAHLGVYHKEDEEIHDFLRSPEDSPQYPRWAALGADRELRTKINRDLALEAIRSRPDLFLLVALQRLAGSCNPDDFNSRRLEATYYAERFAEIYFDPKRDDKTLRIAFGIPRDAPFPSWEEFSRMVSPRPDSAAARWLIAYTDAYQSAGKLLIEPRGPNTTLLDHRLTFLGIWLAAGLIISLFPEFFRPLGVWTLALGGYLVAVYLVGVEHHRYFALAWAQIILLLAVVPEALLRLWPRGRSGS